MSSIFQSWKYLSVNLESNKSFC